MKHRTGSVLDTLRRMATVLDDRPELAPLKNSGTRKVLDTTIAQLDAHATEQVSDNTGKRGATATKRDLIEALSTDHMKPIMNAAKLGVPGGARYVRRREAARSRDHGRRRLGCGLHRAVGCGT